MLIKRLILAIPLTIGWTIYTSQPTMGNIVLGYIFSVVVLFAIRVQGDSFKFKNLPRQIVNLVLYIVFLSYEILKAGIGVARIALSPTMPIKPGTTPVSTQDETGNEVISAISAHGITITPGELVIDFDERDDGVYMIVHSLNIETSKPNLDNDQSKRLKRIKGILGYD